MKCSGFSLPLWCTVLSGAMALGPMGNRGACASNYDPNASATTDWAEDYDLPPGHHYYPVEDYSNTVTSRPAETTEASTTGYHGYHYEYPESDYGYSGEQAGHGQADYEGDSAAAYSFKYGYRYGYPDEPSSSEDSKPTVDAPQSIDDTADVQPDSQPRDYTPWADECDDDFSHEAPAPQIASSSSTGSVTAIEQPAEPETLADYAKWVEVYGYSTGDTWLFRGLLDDNTSQPTASATQSAEVDSTCSRDAYPSSDYRYPDYGYAEYEGAEGTHTLKSSNCVEIWNKYRYEHYYPEVSAHVSSTSSEQASPAQPRGTEQVSSQGACEFEYRCAQESTPAATTVSSAMPQSHDTDYYYADPYAYYGYDYGYGKRHYQWQADPPVAPAAPAVHRESGLELFGVSPAALLTSTDQDLLRALERSAEEPSGVRRAALNAHLEGLDYQAIDFVMGFENTTGIEVLGLADDPLSTAMLLGSYRLLERGEVGRDEAVDLLRRSLQNLSADWAKGVRLITANAYETGEVVRSVEPTPATSADARSVTGVLVTLTLESLWRAGGTIWGFPQRLAEYDWHALLGNWEDSQAANTGLGSDWFQR